MAKVLISISDELLTELDRRATSTQSSRSGYLQALVRRDLATTSDDRQRAVDDLLAGARRRDGQGAEHVRAARTAR